MAEEKATPKKETPPEPVEPTKAQPVLRTEWGLASHRRRDYDCTLPEGTTKEHLTETSLWDHVGNQLTIWDTIRAMAEDGSFVAELIVIYKFGNRVKCAVTNFTELQKIDHKAQSGMGRYEVKQRGMKKWCIMDRQTGEVIREGIGTQTLELKELSDFLSTLAG